MSFKSITIASLIRATVGDRLADALPGWVLSNLNHAELGQLMRLNEPSRLMIGPTISIPDRDGGLRVICGLADSPMTRDLAESLGLVVVGREPMR